MYIAALGTLKNRCVFCPLFSAFGPEPIRSRLEIGTPKVLVTTASLYEKKIAPMREFTAVSQDFNDWSFFARERFADEKFARASLDRTQFADEGEDFAGWEFQLSLVNPKKASVFDYLKDAIFIIDEPTLVEQTLTNFYETIEKHFAEISEADDIGMEPSEIFLDGETLRGKFADKQRVELRALGRTAAATDEEFQFAPSI